MSDVQSPESKPWWQSKSVIGGLVALAAGIAGIFGVVMSPDDQAITTEAILGIAGAIGGLLAVYGRIKASKSIK